MRGVIFNSFCLRVGCCCNIITMKIAKYFPEYDEVHLKAVCLSHGVRDFKCPSY